MTIGAAAFGGIYYLRIVRNSATSFDFKVSVDGITWLTALAAQNFSGFLTIDQAGFGLQANNNHAAAAACHWMRFQ